MEVKGGTNWPEGTTTLSSQLQSDIDFHTELAYIPARSHPCPRRAARRWPGTSGGRQRWAADTVTLRLGGHGDQGGWGCMENVSGPGGNKGAIRSAPWHACDPPCMPWAGYLSFGGRIQVHARTRRWLRTLPSAEGCNLPLSAEVHSHRLAGHSTLAAEIRPRPEAHNPLWLEARRPLWLGARRSQGAVREARHQTARGRSGEGQGVRARGQRASCALGPSGSVLHSPVVGVSNGIRLGLFRMEGSRR